MVDAKAHGAGNNPEFEGQWDALVATTEKLRDAARGNGFPTEEFDRNLRNDLRRILKSKGLSNAQIDAQFAAHPDPLEAAKAFVRGDDLQAIKVAADKIGATSEPSSNIVPAQPESPVEAVSDPMAKLRASGIVMANHKGGDEFAHGVVPEGQAGRLTTRV